MDIKLKARLSAYSKVDSVTSDCEHESVTEEQIDDLFKDTDTPVSVTKSEIDSLFINTTEQITIQNDSTTSSVMNVSHDEIDSLFNH